MDITKLTSAIRFRARCGLAGRSDHGHCAGASRVNEGFGYGGHQAGPGGDVLLFGWRLSFCCLDGWVVLLLDLSLHGQKCGNEETDWKKNKTEKMAQGLSSPHVSAMQKLLTNKDPTGPVLGNKQREMLRFAVSWHMFLTTEKYDDIMLVLYGFVIYLPISLCTYLCCAGACNYCLSSTY